MGKTERPLRATNFNMIHYCLVVRMGRHRCYTGTTREIAVPQQPKAIYKRQSRFLPTNYAQRRVRTQGHRLLKAASNHSATQDCTSNVCVCDGESEVGGCGNDRLNSITMPNGLLPVLEEEL